MARLNSKDFWTTQIMVRLGVGTNLVSTPQVRHPSCIQMTFAVSDPSMTLPLLQVIPRFLQRMPRPIFQFELSESPMQFRGEVSIGFLSCRLWSASRMIATLAPGLRTDFSPLNRVKTFATRISRNSSSAWSLRISTFSGWLGVNGGMIFCTVPCSH